MKTKYKHLNCEERVLIQLSLEKGCTIRAIARSLDRSASSVSRELARNNWCSPQAQAFRPGRPALAGGYRAVLAQQRACVARSSGRKPPLLASDGFLWAQVQKLLKQRYCCGADRGHTATYVPRRSLDACQSRKHLHGALCHAAR